MDVKRFISNWEEFVDIKSEIHEIEQERDEQGFLSDHLNMRLQYLENRLKNNEAGLKLVKAG